MNIFMSMDNECIFHELKKSSLLALVLRRSIAIQLNLKFHSLRPRKIRMSGLHRYSKHVLSTHGQDYIQNNLE